MHQAADSLFGLPGRSKRKDVFATCHAFERGHSGTGCASTNMEHRNQLWNNKWWEVRVQ